MPEPALRKAPVPGKKQESGSLSVYPNPAKDQVTFSYHVPEAGEGLSLVIADVNGVAAATFYLSEAKGIRHWYTRDLPNGVYVYRLRDSRQAYETGQLVISR